MHPMFVQLYLEPDSDQDEQDRRRRAAPDLLVVAGGAGQTAEYPPAAGGSLRDFAVPFTVGAAPVLPLSLTIGKWLLAGTVSPSPPVTWQGIASGTPVADCLSLGEKLAA